MFSVLLPLGLFSPFDSVQQAISANLGSKTYRGDAVLVLINYEEASENNLKNIDVLPELLERISAVGPKQILIDHKASGPTNEREVAALEAALAKLPEKPALVVFAFPSGELPFSEIYSLTEPREQFDVTIPLPEIERHVVMVNSFSDTGFFGAPIEIAATIDSNAGPVPSTAQFLADHDEYLPPGLPTDQRYDVSTIPRFSAVEILSGEQGISQLTGKRVVISRTGVAYRDSVRSARDLSTHQAIIPILGAQTLLEGPPTSLGQLPAFIAAIIAAIAWTFLPRPYGRWVGLTAIVSLIFAPFFLESQLIYQRTADGLLFLLVLAAGRLRIRYKDALVDARDAAESKSWFLAQASHDLRQPIHAIGMLSARLGETDLAPSQKDLIRKIDRSVDGASRMFKSLLDIASLESGSLTPAMAPVSINEILAEVEETQGIAAERAGVELRMTPSEVVVMTDRALTVTLLQNLVSNSIKYATGKKVLIGVRRRGQTVSLCVYDRGEGISEKNVRKVSKEFFRVSARSPIEGSGLGLAIVDRLCKLMDLTFRIKSRTGRGTTALIEGIPITTDQERIVVPSQSTASPLLQGVKVLIVDDDIDTLRATEALVRQWGCEASSAASFPRSPQCDVIISDFDFGNGTTLADFRDTVGQLRQNGTNTIVVSGHAVSFVKQALGDATPIVLGKPLRPAELRSVLMADRMGARE
ncbi:hybrid sensor histidine kinase/response regulator [Altererythrobacter sp. ZODW24]|uniref:ATP-binding response regulator n=1 Tax=Altererythrobacter sp. ZODW24 TaxID=2185142 RepID=UPI0013B3B04D|nr:hybrid sensor histidine kinase/response regulator [Altererythrobacter sp. ZODW24]